MKYTREEVRQYIEEEDVKFIRLAFCDVYGKQKNISIMPDELERAFAYGIAFDASSVEGYGDETHSDLVLRPDCDTLTVLPWRPEHGKVVRMFSDVCYPDGRNYRCDTRYLLKQAIAAAQRAGVEFRFGAEQEFYLFELDEKGKPTKIPYDDAGYMDIAPEDKGENIRREICLTLEQMGIRPESSHHEGGPGQNEIDFRYSDPLTAADNALTLQTVVRTVAYRNGLAADFSAKPLDHLPGNGFHINFSATAVDGRDVMIPAIAGVLAKAADMTAFLNPTENSYKRFGQNRAPKYVSWSGENRSQLVRIPAAVGEYRRAELRSPDPTANPYLCFALMIYAGLAGIEQDLELPFAVDYNLFKPEAGQTEGLQLLPQSLDEARAVAADSAFIRQCIPAEVLEIYCGR
ncbi:MAG: glutamine synthetase [Clostridia bacterium]|nr:glutamine synthetase [Clostridia bacterium]